MEPTLAPGSTCTGDEADILVTPEKGELTKLRIRPMMEACGIDVFKTARDNGFEIDTRKETYGRWNFFALVLIE